MKLRKSWVSNSRQSATQCDYPPSQLRGNKGGDKMLQDLFPFHLLAPFLNSFKKKTFDSSWKLLMPPRNHQLPVIRRWLLRSECRMDYHNQAIWLMASHLSGKHVTKIAATYGGFLKWWYPTTIGFPTKNDHFGVFWGYHHLRKHPYYNRSHLSCKRGGHANIHDAIHRASGGQRCRLKSSHNWWL